MYTNTVTVHVLAKLNGPGGVPLRPGQIAVLEDSPYVRILVMSGNVELIDPPSLDPQYLKEAGLLRDGEEVPEEFLTKKPESKVEAPKPEPVLPAASKVAKDLFAVVDNEKIKKAEAKDEETKDSESK